VLLEAVRCRHKNNARKASANCALVSSLRSQFFHSRRHSSNHANECSTTPRLGISANSCSSLRLTTSTLAPRMCHTISSKMLQTQEIFLIAALLCFLTFLVLFAVKSNGARGIDENSFSGGSRDGRERAVCFRSRPPAAPDPAGG
jgi:hypothetical protein